MKQIRRPTKKKETNQKEDKYIYFDRGRRKEKHYDITSDVFENNMFIALVI